MYIAIIDIGYTLALLDQALSVRTLIFKDYINPFVILMRYEDHFHILYLGFSKDNVMSFNLWDYIRPYLLFMPIHLKNILGYLFYQSFQSLKSLHILGGNWFV